MTEWWNEGGGCELVFGLIISALGTLLTAVVLWIKNKLKQSELDEQRKKKRRAISFKKAQLCDKQNEFIKIVTSYQTKLDPDYKKNGEELIDEYKKIVERDV